MRKLTKLQKRALIAFAIPFNVFGALLFFAPSPLQFTKDYCGQVQAGNWTDVERMYVNKASYTVDRAAWDKQIRDFGSIQGNYISHFNKLECINFGFFGAHPKPCVIVCGINFDKQTFKAQVHLVPYGQAWRVREVRFKP